MMISLQSSKQCFLSVEKLPVDDAEKFCEWCLSDFSWKDELTSEGCTEEIVMMAPAAGFYTTPGSGVDQVRLAYVLCRRIFIGFCLCWRGRWKNIITRRNNEKNMHSNFCSF